LFSFFGIIPKVRVAGFFFEFFYLVFLSIIVKETPLRPHGDRLDLSIGRL
jgi:hypothetical protein